MFMHYDVTESKYIVYIVDKITYCKSVSEFRNAINYFILFYCAVNYFYYYYCYCYYLFIIPEDFCTVTDH